MACTLYGAASGVLLLMLTLSYADMEKSKRGSEYRMRMHLFAALACFFNLIASIDLKAYADRLPLIVTEIFNELAYSCLFIVLFHMVNQWVDVITLGGRQKWGKRQREILPFMCVLVTLLRVGFGIAQWVSVKHGLRDGLYNGTLNNMKLVTSFCTMAFYTGIGIYSSVYEPMQKNGSSTPAAAAAPAQPSALDIHNIESGGGGGSDRGRMVSSDGLGIGRAVASVRVLKNTVNDKIQANLLRKKTVLHTRYLVGLFVCLLLYCIYVLSTAFLRLGKTEERGAPCSFVSKHWFTGQGIVIFVVTGYIVLNGSSEFDATKGGGCAIPQSSTDRKQRRAAAVKKQREIANRNKAEKQREAQRQQALVDRESSGVVFNDNPVAARTELTRG
eukprot:CAMPEP_0114346524 /NCGR_PEP_ID=MMETSP0101-20121206/13130_1 /TAXON_ID=38822 ORGANISM="Pteridomonas danica, Strain PT" /NCGR_SAMPLE_ID=MMETSP0101 /ASSEMBLY_ACC=CAM_ASM_000211 /LENGTH=387 /DNA_ID=CAMNT_0001483207 /DNA_START=122 /DNA_END=1285 /DNA_ORIENTATION=-